MLRTLAAGRVTQFLCIFSVFLQKLLQLLLTTFLGMVHLQKSPLQTLLLLRPLQTLVRASKPRLRQLYECDPSTHCLVNSEIVVLSFGW